MKYRRLGKTNLKVSVIGMGTWQLGGEWGKTFTQDEVDPMFRRAKQLGINLIDTAECYGDHTSESLIGGAIHSERRDWIVATKFGHKFTGHLQRSEPRRPQDLQEQLDASLRALRTDYIDVYQFHSWGDKDFDQPAVWDVLERARRAGKIRHVGNSISSNNEGVRQLEAAAQAHVEVIQALYNRLDRRPEAHIFPECLRQDLGVMARVPLASGFLSGKYKPGAAFGPTDVRHNQDRATIDATLREVEKIAREEVPPGVPMAQWALAWCLRHDAVSCVIPGCKNVQQVETNARAADLPEVRDDHPQAWKD